MSRGISELMSKTSNAIAARLARSAAARRKRRLESHNLRRLAARDLADRGLTRAQFEFDLNLGRPADARMEH